MSAALLAMVFLGPAGPAGAEPGLIAHYSFEQGHGLLLHDQSGRGNHGTIRGATWVHSGEGYVLRFDGKDDQVDCGRSPTLSPKRTVSVEAWLYPEAVPLGHAGVAGKNFGSYVLSYYRDGRIWWFIAGGDNKCGAHIAPGAWYHIVGTFDGQMLRLYRDGVLVEMAQSKRSAIPSDGPMMLGLNTGDARYVRGARFQGMLAEVRVYDRALSAEEVAGHYRRPRRNGQVSIQPRLAVHRQRIEAEVDLRSLGRLPADASLAVELVRPGATAPLAASRIDRFPADGLVEVLLDAKSLSPAPYTLRAAVSSAGKPLGAPAAVEIQWPGQPGWKNAPGVKVLNNLVAKLLSLGGREPVAAGRYRFTNPREGWVFLGSTAGAATGSAGVRLEGAEVLRHSGPGTQEAMRWLSQGEHEIAVEGSGLQRIAVRAVPELVFAKIGSGPHVPELGPHDLELFRRHVLPQVNVLVAHPRKELAPLLAEWKGQGKRLLREVSVPGLRDPKPPRIEEVEKAWMANEGMTDPLWDGVIVDEFWVGLEAGKVAVWTEVMRRIHNDPRFRGRLFYPYCGPMFGSEPAERFIRTTIEAGWAIALERYLPEQRSPRDARLRIETDLGGTIEAWEKATPGIRQRTIVCLGTFSQPYCTLDCNPAVNYKVYLDMQFNHVANDPRCFGIRGLMSYTSSYMDAETIRWLGRLLRHYAIEGRTDPLARDPLMLMHLVNPEFEEGLRGWSVEAAEAGSVAPRLRSGLSWLEGRWPMTSQGDTVLWMKRSAGRPNVVSQAVRGLRPGRLYLVRMFSGDWQDPKRKQKLGVSLAVAGADVLAGRSFQHVFTQAPSRKEEPEWLNYHGLFFRARGPEATLRISDWAAEGSPGGPAGQELWVNFVEVRPCDE